MSEQTAAPYPQAKPFTAEEAEAFLVRPLIAKLASHNADGTIHIAPSGSTMRMAISCSAPRKSPVKSGTSRPIRK